MAVKVAAVDAANVAGGDDRGEKEKKKTTRSKKEANDATARRVDGKSESFRLPGPYKHYFNESEGRLQGFFCLF